MSRRSFTNATALAAGGLVAGAAEARTSGQQPSPGAATPWVMGDAESIDMKSAAGDDWRISVGLPISYGQQPDKSYPVLYILDGSVMFASAVEISRLMGATGETSEVIIVGIGYPISTDHATFGFRRNYDFTTANWDKTAPLRRYIEGDGARPMKLGGAPALLDFITEQVQPFIAKNYRVDTSDQALYGHSLGGKMVFHVLFNRPKAFGKYLASSPGLIFNDWDAFQQEEDYAKNHSDLPVQLYLAAGSEELLDFAKVGIVSGTARMAEVLQLRRYPGLRMASEIQTRKTHLTTWTENLQRGLELFWPGTRLRPDF